MGQRGLVGLAGATDGSAQLAERSASDVRTEENDEKAYRHC